MKGRVYLAGSIHHEFMNDKLNEVYKWRDEVSEKLVENGFLPVSPMRNKENGRYGSVKEIVVRDLNDVSKCDAMIVYMKSPLMSGGTAMEMFYASYILNIPIIVVTTKDIHDKDSSFDDLSPEEGKSKLSPWIIYFATSIVNSFDEAVDVLNWLF